MPIQSFRDRRCERILSEEPPGGRFPANLLRRTFLQLQTLHKAKRLEDLRDPPGNRLEALSGDSAGQHSIRVNRQFRICFRWTPLGAADVEFVDYHR